MEGGSSVSGYNFISSRHPFVCLVLPPPNARGVFLYHKEIIMRIDAVQTIKDRLKMSEVLERYGYTADRKGFICCPFHLEKTPSMRIYDKDYHCFGCQEHGDVITFIQKLFRLSFQDTLRKIDADFGLNIYGDHSFEELRRSQYMQKVLQAKREREKREKQKAEDDYWKAFDEWKRLDDNRRIYRPKSPDEELHPLFVESLQKLDYQKYVLDCLDERRMAL
jgi:DNA primase